MPDRQARLWNEVESTIEAWDRVRSLNEPREISALIRHRDAVLTARRAFETAMNAYKAFVSGLDETLFITF